MKNRLTILGALVIGAIGAHATGCLDNAYAAATRYSLLVVRTAFDTAATCESSAGAGDLCAGGDVRTDDDVFVGDALTVAGATTLKAVTITGLVTNAFAISEPFDYGASKGIYGAQFDGTVADGTAGALNILYTGRGNKIAYVPLGAGQTITVPTMAAGGLDITGDQADNEGFELYGSIDGASGRMYTPGVDAAFQFCATLTVTDVSDTDFLLMGMRKPELTNATLANYDTYAIIGIETAAATATLHTITEDDAGGQTNTTLAATWADTASKILCVKVDAARAVTYTINGSADANAVAFSFDAGEPLIPFIWFIHAGAADCVPILSNWTWGLQTP